MHLPCIKTGPNVLKIAIFYVATLLSRNTTTSPNWGSVMHHIRQVESLKNMTCARQCISSNIRPIQFNSSTNDNFLDWTKVKAFADDKLNVAKIVSVFDRIENIVGKGENTGNQHFLLFQQCFQKFFYVGSLKLGIVWER